MEENEEPSNPADFDPKARVEWMEIEIEQAFGKISEEILKLGSFNVISNISYINQERNLQDFQDYKENSLPVVAEYVALLCLKNPFSIANSEFVDQHAFQQSIDEIQMLGLKLVTQIQFVRRFRAENGSLSDSVLARIIDQFQSEEYYVRNPTFEEHHWHVLEGLYSKLDAELTALVGFTAADAIDLCMSINDLMNDRLRQHFKSSAQYADEQYYEILRYKAGGKLKNFYRNEILDELVKLERQELKRHFFSMAQLYVSTTLGHFYSFTLDDLIRHSGMDAKIVQKFLQALSITFQEVPIDFYELTGTHPLKEKPVIFGDDRYIVPSLSLLDWSVDKLFEKRLLNSKYASKYSDIKGDYLNEKTLLLLRQTMPSAVIHANVEFHNGAENGETDGLVILDDCLFIVESKSHRITDAAKEGKRIRVEKHLGDILDDAYKQANKVLAYIDSKDEVTFKPKRARSFSLRGVEFRERFIVITAYEQIGHIVSLINKSNDAGLFQGDVFPYAVSLYDLILVSELFEFESLFPFYLKRRSEFFSMNKIMVNDEIDVIGSFFNTKLYTDHLDAEGEYDMIHIGGYLDEFNRYYFWKQGLIKGRFQNRALKSGQA